MSVAAVINSWLRYLRVVPFEGGEQPMGRSAGRVAPEVKRNWEVHP